MILTETHEGTTIKLEFLESRNQKNYYYGKSWPITTQCVVYYNNRIVGIGEVVKHEQDAYNLEYARIVSAKKAFKNSNRWIWPEMRKRFWDILIPPYRNQKKKFDKIKEELKNFTYGYEDQ